MSEIQTWSFERSDFGHFIYNVRNPNKLVFKPSKSEPNKFERSIVRFSDVDCTSQVQVRQFYSSERRTEIILGKNFRFTGSFREEQGQVDLRGWNHRREGRGYQGPNVRPENSPLRKVRKLHQPRSRRGIKSSQNSRASLANFYTTTATTTKIDEFKLPINDCLCRSVSRPQH